MIAFLLELPKDMQREPIPYLRVLAANARGREILKQIKQKSTLTIITKTADYQAADMFLADCRATELSALCQNSMQKSGADYLTPPVILS